MAGGLATDAPPSGEEFALVAGGCFWGVEHLFRQIPGVSATCVGYTAGHTSNPTYKQVCTDTTGHAEAVRATFDPSVVSFGQLLRTFLSRIDPTTKDSQGPDYGTQYRSTIYYYSPEQKAAADEAIAWAQDAIDKGTYPRRVRGSRVVTTVEAAGDLWLAEDYHQHYVEKGGSCTLPRTPIAPIRGALRVGPRDAASRFVEAPLDCTADARADPGMVHGYVDGMTRRSGASFGADWDAEGATAAGPAGAAGPAASGTAGAIAGSAALLGRSAPPAAAASARPRPASPLPGRVAGARTAADRLASASRARAADAPDRVGAREVPPPSRSSLQTWRHLLETRPEMRAVSLVYLVQGLGRFSSLAVFVFLKDGAGLEPPAVAAVTSVAKLPWVVKPLYGFLSDAVPLWGYRRKSYLLLCGLVGAFALLCLSAAPYSAAAVLLCLTPSAAAVAFSDVVADSLVVEAARELDGAGQTGAPPGRKGRGGGGLGEAETGARWRAEGTLPGACALPGKGDAFAGGGATARIEERVAGSVGTFPGTAVAFPETSPPSAPRPSGSLSSSRSPSCSGPSCASLSEPPEPPITGASLQSLCWAWQSSGQILACSAGGRAVKRLGPRAVIALSALAPLIVSVSALSVREQRQGGAAGGAGPGPLRAVQRAVGRLLSRLASRHDAPRLARGEHELASLLERGGERAAGEPPHGSLGAVTPMPLEVAAASGRDSGGLSLRAHGADSPSRAAQHAGGAAVAAAKAKAAAEAVAAEPPTAAPRCLAAPPEDASARPLPGRAFSPAPGSAEPSTLSLLVAQARALASALSRPSLLLPTLFGFLWQAAPNVSTTMQYYESEALGFDAGMLGDLQLVGAIACLAGVWAFDSFLASRPLKQVFVATGIGAAVAACSQLVLIHRWNLALGIPDRLFALADAAVVEAAGQVAFLPALVLAARSCPEGVEATLFAAVMSVNNLGMGLGDGFGAALAKALGVSRHSFGNMGILVVVAAALQLVPLAFLPWLPNEVCGEQAGQAGGKWRGADGDGARKGRGVESEGV